MKVLVLLLQVLLLVVTSIVSVVVVIFLLLQIIVLRVNNGLEEIIEEARKHADRKQSVGLFLVPSRNQILL